MTADLTLPESRAEILDRIASAAQAVGRKPESVTLVAVSKRQPEERIAAGLAAGQRVFGENRIQEAQERWSHRRKTIDGLELRLVGSLQSNKARDAVELFDIIESLDRESLAKALRKAMDETGKAPRLYIQVNTGEESQKSGIAPSELGAFLTRMRTVYRFEIVGLMCLPPSEEPAGLHFALLAKLADEHGIGELSMGMSGDFETAIGLGATSVRIGTAFFGARDR